jgi:hypothetical protein
VALASGCGESAEKPKPAPVPRAGDFVGVYADDVFFGDDRYRRDALGQQRDAGIGLIRQPFAWKDIETAPGRYEFGRYDALVGAAAGAGIRVLPMVLGPEPGAKAAGEGRMKPPTNVEAYARYAAALVARYGREGSFWSENPKAPKLPIRSWQVWNEPNIPAFWSTGPDPAAYAKLLKAAAASIRKADRRAEVVTAGLPTSHLGIGAARFLQGVYDAGVGESFDAVAVHSYAPTPETVIERAQEAADVVERNGDDARVWVTEFGWGTGGKPGPLTVSRDTQADYIERTIKLLDDARERLRLRGFVLFQWHDPKPFPGRREIWPFYAGLREAGGKPKPGFDAFKRAVARLR